MDVSDIEDKLKVVKSKPAKNFFDFWKKLPIGQKISLSALVLFLTVLPLGVIVVLSPTRLNPRAAPITPPDSSPSPSPSPQIGFGNAASFNGDGAIIKINNSENINLKKDFTVESWIKLHPITSFPHTVNVFISKRTNLVVNYRLLISVNRYSDDYYEITYSFNIPDKIETSSCGVSFITSNIKVNKDQLYSWHHVAMVVSLDGVVNSYLDGEKSSQAGTFVDGCSVVALIYIGDDVTENGEANFPFDADIDEFRISDTARYQSNFRVPKTPLITDSMTLVHYRFDQTSSSVPVIDQAGGDNSGYITGNVRFIPSTIVLPPQVSPSPSIKPTPSPTIKPTPSPTPSPLPVVTLLNSSFEFDRNNDEVPDYWLRGTGSNTKDVRNNALSHDGKFSFKFIGVKDVNKSLNQVINGSWPANQTLYISGWTKVLKSASGGTVQLQVIAKYNDNTSQKFTLAFPSGAAYDWTYRSGSLTLGKNAKSLTVKAIYSKKSGEGYFDHLNFSDRLTSGLSQPTKLAPQSLTFEDMTN